METIKARGVLENELTFQQTSDIERVVAMLENGENFIIEWSDESGTHAKLMLATNLLSSVKNGEVILTSSTKEVAK